MARLALALGVVILLLTVGGIALIVRVALRRGGDATSAATPRVPRSLLLALGLALALVAVLVLSLRIAGGL